MRRCVLLSMLWLGACIDKSNPTSDTSEAEGSTTATGSGEDGGDGGSGTGNAGSDEGGGSGDEGGDSSDEGGGEDGSSDTLEIAGNYTSDMGEEHVITESYWSMDFDAGELYEYSITQYDNDSRWLVAENLSADEAGFWSRFDWFEDSGGTLYVCQTAGLAASEGDAIATSPADASDLSGGCPYYGWLLLTPI